MGGFIVRIDPSPARLGVIHAIVMRSLVHGVALTIPIAYTGSRRSPGRHHSLARICRWSPFDPGSDTGCATIAASAAWISRAKFRLASGEKSKAGSGLIRRH